MIGFLYSSSNYLILVKLVVPGFDNRWPLILIKCRNRQSEIVSLHSYRRVQIFWRFQTTILKLSKYTLLFLKKMHFLGNLHYRFALYLTGVLILSLPTTIFQVPFFSQMDNQLLDAICERLVSSLCTQGTYIVREGDPVTEMLFIIRGKLESSTTNGGRTGFFNSTTLKSGDFCGEELLGWALVPKPTVNLPSSTRTVKALIEVEAFALQAEDLKFVANQFRRLHSKRLQHTFRYYSHHWRTWASCFIQAAWRRYKRRKMARDLSMRESFCSMRSDDSNGEDDSPPKQNLAMKIMSGSRKGPQNMKELPKLRKPDEPDFSAEPCE